MKIVRVLRMLRRWFTPPGNRGSLESSYRQTNTPRGGRGGPSPAAGQDKGV